MLVAFVRKLSEFGSQGETMEINGIAHTFPTASNFERSREFYRQLPPFLGLKSVINTKTTYYCVGGRTAVGISAPSPEHAGAAFEQKRVGLHHLRFRARARTNGRRAITRCCSRIPTASGWSSTMCRGRGCWREAPTTRHRRPGERRDHNPGRLL
jgi:hypothetical protein